MPRRPVSGVERKSDFEAVTSVVDPTATSAGSFNSTKAGTKEAPDDAGAFESPEKSLDQYFATSGPPQLKW
jgi:hypothetical protein